MNPYSDVANAHSEEDKLNLYVHGLSSTINMVDAHHREIIHRRGLTFEILCHFCKSKDEEYRARIHHITFNVVNKQRGINLTQTHVG